MRLRRVLSGVGLKTVLCCLPLYAQVSATTQQPAKPVEPRGATLIFEDASLGLQFAYPAQMVKDTSSANASNEARRCLHSLLSIRTPPPVCDEHTGCTEEQLSAPVASLSLLEFDRSCVSSDEWQNHDRLLASLTKALYTTPGAEAIGQPLVYDYGGALNMQKMHMAAVRQQEKDSLGKTHFVVRMNLATMVHDRAIIWVIQANNHTQLNYLEKTRVSFDGKPPVALFPLDIQEKDTQDKGDTKAGGPRQ
jgi:hypothetical protein